VGTKPYASTLWGGDGINGLDVRTSDGRSENNSGKTRAQALLDLIEIVEFQTREYDRSFVLMQCFGLLRRDPDQGGYEYLRLLLFEAREKMLQ
jgi:hypothetical protein